ncbi:MAG: phosphoribosylformylglycinamidine synthase subunit PurS [Terriglobales bacterium]
MHVRVYVALKKTVLDPQGQAIQAALARQGYAVAAVRQGKVFELELAAETPEAARRQAEAIAREVLSNPVIEEFEVLAANAGRT